MRVGIKVYLKSNNSSVIIINIQSQIEKQTLSSELKDNKTGEKNKTRVLTNSPASYKPSQNRFIRLQNNLNHILSLHKQILLLFLEMLIKKCVKSTYALLQAHKSFSHIHSNQLTAFSILYTADMPKKKKRCEVLCLPL